ncbi:MAG: SAP domain-containing protein [Chloroflexi bacterium]|nr:SAP domain-containing protein [Chloroflexota bacterium]MCC6895155.1 SAP domain-containing protein [Anaerolineae bacterium]
MQRPPLDLEIKVKDFLAFYWLKAELVEFCRANGLPTGGSKGELTERIAHFLRTGELLLPTTRPKIKSDGQLPTLDTIINKDYRSSQVNRAFFEEIIGKKFHFSTAFQQYFKDNVGKTFRDAIEYWYTLEERARRGEKTTIAPQFEYNQFVRQYHEQNPNTTHAAAVAAWKAYRSQRREDAGSSEAG